MEILSPSVSKITNRQACGGARLYIDFVHKNEQEAIRALLNGVSKKGVPRIGHAFPGHGSSSFATDNSGVRAPYPGLFIYGMPNRNPHFTGREKILTAIHQTFERGEAIAQTQSLIGLGGVGKSQIAIEYAYRYSQEYTHIVWVNAENDGTLYASMEAFALEMDLVKKDAKYEPDQLLTAVRNWMNRHDNWLFIFDNAGDDVATEEVATSTLRDRQIWLEKYLPLQNFGRRHVLITSRYRNWSSIATSLSVEVFSEEEARDFLTKRTRIPHDKFQDDLAKQLGYLSLALEQAAAYICNNTGYDYQPYLSLLKGYNLLEVLSKPSDEITRQSVYTTWDIFIKKINDESAKQLLNLCAFFAPDRIDLSWFTNASDCLPQPLQDILPDKLRFNKAKAELTKYSLVEIRDGKLYIHRLLQEVIKDRLKTEQNVWLNHCVRILNKLIDYDFSTSEKRALFVELVPHIHSVVAQIPPDTQTEEIANLYFFLGYGYREFADYPQALEWFLKALDIRENVLGASHPDTATTYNNIALVYDNQGEYAKALEWYVKALPVFVGVLGLDHPNTKTVISNIAIAYQESGNLKPFEEWLENQIMVSP